MTTKKIVIQSFFQSCFSKIILSVLFTRRIVKFACLVFDRKKVDRLHDTKNVRKPSSLSFLVILTLRICDAALELSIIKGILILIFLTEVSKINSPASHVLSLHAI